MGKRDGFFLKALKIFKSPELLKYTLFQTYLETI